MNENILYVINKKRSNTNYISTKQKLINNNNKNTLIDILNTKKRRISFTNKRTISEEMKLNEKEINFINKKIKEENKNNLNEEKFNTNIDIILTDSEKDSENSEKEFEDFAKKFKRHGLDKKQIIDFDPSASKSTFNVSLSVESNFTKVYFEINVIYYFSKEPKILEVLSEGIFNIYNKGKVK